MERKIYFNYFESNFYNSRGNYCIVCSNEGSTIYQIIADGLKRKIKFYKSFLNPSDRV